MGVLVSEVVDATLGAVDSQVGPQLVATWVSERYRELTNRSRMRHLLKRGELVLPAVIDDGTVTVTAGSRVVVGTSTARTAWAAVADDIVGRYFRVDAQRNWFRIAGRDGSGDLILESEYVRPFSTADDPQSGAGYKVVARFHALAEDLRHIGVLTHPRLHQPLSEVDHQEVDQAMASRVLVADVPEFWCEAGVDADGRKLVEIYPYPRTDQLIPYSYYVFSPVLKLDSALPAEIDLHVLKTGALVDIMRWEMAQALRANRPEAAATWRNEMNTMTTRWEDKIREAVKADRASDTLSLQMHTGGFPTGAGRLVRDARDQVWMRGRRP
jgi:hypothetical protein